MHLTPREQERLLLATAADLARRRIARGARIGVTEAVALVCDEVLEAAWDGESLARTIERGRAVVPRDRLLPGAAALAPTVQVEALFPHGTVLVHLDAPLGPPEGEHPPGAVIAAAGHRELARGRERREARVTNTGHAAVWISSHFPLDALNPAVIVAGLPEGRWRLDLPAGVCREVAAGESTVLPVVRTGQTEGSGHHEAGDPETGHTEGTGPIEGTGHIEEGR